MSKPDLVLVHGWGLNEEIWSHIITPLEAEYEVHALSLLGYGKRHSHHAPGDLCRLADDLLAQAPESAIWCGWSLGGMAAMQAALNSPERFTHLNLICTTPRFTKRDDWLSATDIETFQKFADDLSADYARGLRRFLLLQAGAFDQARDLAKQAMSAITKHPSPSMDTLMSGLDILRNADLRAELGRLETPCTVIAGQRDRVVSPSAASYLAASIPNATLMELNSGHAPMLSHPEEVVTALIELGNEMNLITDRSSQ